MLFVSFYSNPPLFYAAVFGVSFIGALLLTPIARRVALSLGVFDEPDPSRKIHSQAVPYLGGMAIYVATMIGLLLLFGMLHQFTAIIIGATLMMLFGLWDDRKGMAPKVKIFGQVVSAIIVIYAGMHFNLFGTLWLDVPLTLVWIVGITNAVNLLDNMDGLSSGIVAISSFFLFLVAARSEQYLVSALALALTGGCLGFLRYNFSPATIFMGDAGSLFLGYVVSVTAIKLRLPFDNITNFFIPVLALALPILDTTLVTISRLRAGRKVSQGGKDHTSHRLVNLGLRRPIAVLALYGLNIVYGAMAVFLRPANAHLMLIGAGAFFVACLSTFLRLSEIKVLEVTEGQLSAELHTQTAEAVEAE